MKLMHTTTTTLNTREFNKLSDRIIDSLYELNPDIQDLYDIHVNFIDDEWRVDFLPAADNLPVISVETYTDYMDDGTEILHIVPDELTDLPSVLRFKDENDSYGLCMNYVNVFEFIIGLYDFEYEL
jgi:hypothetical protein